MTLFPAEFSTKARRFLRKLSPAQKQRVRSGIDKLETDPFPQEVERVQGYKREHVFRIRVGDYRILYIIRYNPHKLIVVRIDKRSRVYDR
jgi:mRNA interferase RelE/StbE